jgi:poly-gamma-glutamate capsule biosynthesis protein CapA/YwtB (metallophosphatase superfamily)
MVRGFVFWFAAVVTGLATAVAIVVALAPAGMPAATSAVANPATVTIRGELDGRRDRLDFVGVSVAINGVGVPISANGSFDGDIALAPYYRVDITGDPVFAMVQTFGNEELRDDSCTCLSIPPIELVAKRPGRIELFFGGDSMAGRRYFHTGQRNRSVLKHDNLDADLDRLFDHVRPYIATSDFASINLESVVAESEPGPPAPKKYLFFSPPQLPAALRRAGIDHVSLGNNHTADYRDAGMKTTIDALVDGGIRFSGGGMNVAQAEQAARVKVGNTRLALFGFVGWRGDWSPNQIARADKAGAAWGTNSAIDRVTRRELAAGHVPIMEYHGNMEYMDRPSDLSLPRFRRAVDLGSPLVIGHHPHVTQGLEIYKGSLIAHSLGNFLFDQDHPHTHSTFALKVWMENGRFLRAEPIPLQILDYRPVPAVGGMREAVLRRLFWLSEEMGTNLKLSGGHAAVWRENRKAGSSACTEPGEFTLARFAPHCGDRASEYGRNLIPRGDFTNVQMGVARDRYWKAQNARLSIRTARNGTGVLELSPLAAHKSFHLMSASYLRDIYATRFTFKARVKLPFDAEVELLTRDKPPEGSPPARAVLGESVATRQLRGSGDWQDVRFDFWLPPAESPRLPPGPEGAAHPFRPILRIQYIGKRLGDDEIARISDIALIEWPPEDIQDDRGIRWWWTHARPLPGRALARN